MIWNQRNQVRLHQPSYSPYQIASVAKDRLIEFLAVQTTSSASSSFNMGSMETSTVGCDKEILMGPFSQRSTNQGLEWCLEITKVRCWPLYHGNYTVP